MGCAKLTTSTSALRKGLVRLRTAPGSFRFLPGFLDGGCVEARTRNRLPHVGDTSAQSFPSPEYMQIESPLGRPDSGGTTMSSRPLKAVPSRMMRGEMMAGGLGTWTGQGRRG